MKKIFLPLLLQLLPALVVTAADSVTLCLTNGSLINGPLVTLTDSNVTLMVDGRKKTFTTNEVRWQEVVAVTKPAVPAIAQAGATVVPAPTVSMNRACTEAELRAQLKSPEGQALLRQIHDQMIGAETDPRARKASEYYFTTMQEFADGKISLADIQGQAQKMRGQLDKYKSEMQADPQHERWANYRNMLDQFIQQPLP